MSKSTTGLAVFFPYEYLGQSQVSGGLPNRRSRPTPCSPFGNAFNPNVQTHERLSYLAEQHLRRLCTCLGFSSALLIRPPWPPHPATLHLHPHFLTTNIHSHPDGDFYVFWAVLSRPRWAPGTIAPAHLAWTPSPKLSYLSVTAVRHPPLNPFGDRAICRVSRKRVGLTFIEHTISRTSNLELESRIDRFMLTPGCKLGCKSRRS
jgi:hypothetical protein